MDFIVIVLSIAVGYRIAICVRHSVTRTPLIVLVGIAIGGFFVGQNTAVVRVDGVFDVMPNHVIMGMALGAVVFEVIRDVRFAAVTEATRRPPRSRGKSRRPA